MSNESLESHFVTLNLDFNWKIYLGKEINFCYAIDNYSSIYPQFVDSYETSNSKIRNIIDHFKKVQSNTEDERIALWNIDCNEKEYFSDYFMMEENFEVDKIFTLTGLQYLIKSKKLDSENEVNNITLIHSHQRLPLSPSDCKLVNDLTEKADEPYFKYEIISLLQNDIIFRYNNLRNYN